jgi:hypothetical protein
VLEAFPVELQFVLGKEVVEELTRVMQAWEAESAGPR